MKQKVLDKVKEQPSTFPLKPLCLLVEDENALGEGLQFNLIEEGFSVIWVTSGQDALNAIDTYGKEVSIMILDLMLPDMGGMSVLERIRKQNLKVPILILSAKSQEKEKVQALELGADDYVTKPFGLMELLARVKGLCKRYSNSTPPSSRSVQLGCGHLDTHTLMATTAQGEQVRLSPIEAQLFLCFSQNTDVILSREQLLEEVWQYGTKIETRTVDVFVGKLRKIIEKDPQNPQFLISVRGAGYMAKKNLV